MSDPEELEFEAEYERATDELEKLRRIANEAWSHAATVDGLMRYLGPLLDAAEQRGYAKGLIEGDSGGRREGYRIGQRDALAPLRKDGVCTCLCGGAAHRSRRHSDE